MHSDRGWTPRHTKEELNEVAAAAMTGGEKERDRLARMMRPYVIGVTRDYARLGDYTREQADEIKQSAWLGVWLSLQNYDPEMGTKFSTYAFYYMVREIRQWMAKNSRALPLSRRAWEQARRIEEAYADEYPEGDITTATDDELAALVIADTDNMKLSRSVEQAGDIMRAKKAAYEMDPDLDARSSQSAESEYFETEHDADHDALLTIENMRDAASEDEAYGLALDFCDRHGYGAEIADKMMEALTL